MRTTKAQLDAEAAAALVDAFAAVGLHAEPAGDADLVVDGPAGPIAVEIKAASTLTPAGLPSVVDREEHPDRLVVVVADRLIGSVPAQLDELGWGHLDRRGHLRFRAGGVFIDADVAPSPRQRTVPATPISGRVAVGVALVALTRPTHAFGSRELARALEASPSTVHDAITRLGQASLVDRARLPLVPELFWALAEVWSAERTPVAQRPTAADGHPRRGLAFPFVETGDRAATHWGAPLAVRAGSPPDFYVGAANLHRAVRSLDAADLTSAACTLAPAPVDVVIRESLARDGGSPWAHPVVVALDLAQDRSRGQEILADWTPPREFTRVW